MYVELCRGMKLVPRWKGERASPWPRRSLDAAAARPLCAPHQPAGRSLPDVGLAPRRRWRKVRAPWKHGCGQRPPGVTPGKVQQKTNRHPASLGPWAARVKRCGKSAPRDRQRKRHGKPHREQDQIGMAGSGGNAGSKPASRPAIRVGCSRRPAMAAPDEWPSRSFRAPDRTRLTGRLVTSNQAKRPACDAGLFQFLVSRSRWFNPPGCRRWRAPSRPRPPHARR